MQERRRRPLLILALSMALAIDPLLVYSSYLGGGGVDDVNAVAVDALGYIYLAGETDSLDFPVTRPIQANNAGLKDAWLAKLDPSGSTVLFATYFGGSRNDRAYGIALDGQGGVSIAGDTDSDDFPTRNAWIATKPGDRNGFVARFRADGSDFIWSSYVGGARQDPFDPATGVTNLRAGITADGAGRVWVTGSTSARLPLIAPVQGTLRGMSDAFVVGFDPGGAAIAATFFGGSGNESGNGIGLDALGGIHFVGTTSSSDFPILLPLQASLGSAAANDAFLVRLAPGGTRLVYSTYLGGNGTDSAWGLAVESGGADVLVGQTDSSDFPLVAPFQPVLVGGIDAFVSRISPDGASLEWSTFLGGSANDSAYAVALASDRSIHVAGRTFSGDFPIVFASQTTLAGTGGDAYVTHFPAGGGEPLWSTFHGGDFIEQGLAVAVAPAGRVWLGGDTFSTNLPTRTPIQSVLQGTEDALLAAFECPGPAPATIGNTLLGVRLGATQRFVWTDTLSASEYRLYRDTIKSGAFPNLEARAGSGIPGITLPVPAEPLVFYRVLGASCAGEGI